MWSRWNYNNIGSGSHPFVVVVVVVVGGIVIERAGIGIAGITNIIQSSVNGARRRVRVGEEGR
jgi:hypothetical protein